ncbi:hypothetical protein [Streptomyces chartreusis]|uniref:hypothetical protein n=1 Tax=Streptomyces chartreusis TaxID=1969 RepID=UPI0038113EF3
MVAKVVGNWASARTVEEVYGHPDQHSPGVYRRFERGLGGGGVTALQLLSVVPSGSMPTRAATDRLEVLTALLAAPTVDPLFREDVIVEQSRLPTGQ